MGIANVLHERLDLAAGAYVGIKPADSGITAREPDSHLCDQTASVQGFFNKAGRQKSSKLEMMLYCLSGFIWGDEDFKTGD